jgi:NDP-sugar pyrophosphorylase family protein
MRAVVLAGGLGEKLRSYTAVLPKPLMRVGDFEVIIRQGSRICWDTGSIDQVRGQ